MGNLMVVLGQGQGDEWEDVMKMMAGLLKIQMNSRSTLQGSADHVIKHDRVQGPVKGPRPTMISKT